MSKLTDVALIDGSPAALIVAELVEQYGIDDAHRLIDEFMDSMSVLEAAAFAADFKNVWARPKQRQPSGDWEICGHLEGRGAGKTLGISKWVNDEVENGRAPLICLLAQDEQSSIQLHVTGPSGLIATAKPWFRPHWRASDLELVWPNGSRAYVRTPEVPGKIRGLDYHLTWASELQSWPTATMDEAWMNVEFSTRLGLARIIWDATSKRRHPLLKRLVKEATEWKP